MKKLTLILSVALILFITACGNNTGNSNGIDSSGSTGTDTTSHEPATAIPDNSNATNPSVPDTAFQDTVPQ
jgi:hypothetical protein